MAVRSVAEVSEAEALDAARRENETLYAVIKTVGSSLDLDRVLGGIVDIATDATGCHACFIYFLEGDRLVLRAASSHYSELLGEVEMSVDEGLAGWVARTKTPEFIPDSAMADPRMKYIPELEEERFQSMVAVPILAKSGDVIGVAVLHTAAPREFEDDVLNFLVHTASLVAGAIENAQLYEETSMRVQALTTLTELSQAIAAVTEPEDLYGVVARGARALLGADVSQVYRLDVEAEELVLKRSDPEDAPDPGPRPGGAALVLELMRKSKGRARSGRRNLPATLWPGHEHDGLLIAPLGAGDEQLGILCLIAHDKDFSPEDSELLAAVADQTAVALKKIELIERLTAENTVKDMFDAIAAGSVDTAEAKSREAGCDLGKPHIFIYAERAPDAEAEVTWPELVPRIEAQLRRLVPHAMLDSRPDHVRGLAPLPNGSGADVERVRAACDAVARELGLVVGLSEHDHTALSARRRMREASDAARIGGSLVADGGAVSYEQLGAYRYLVHLEMDDAPRDRYRTSIERLNDYDAKRGARLVETLEQYLADRGSITASARALYVHPNTVRQRLERIERVADLDLASADLLSLELALKLVRLHRVREGRA